MVPSETLILRSKSALSHGEADRLSRLALRSGARTVILDLSPVDEAVTAAFARLVLLRRELLRCGRDLRLAALHDRPARLFEVHRLAAVLPLLNEIRPPRAAVEIPLRTPVPRSVDLAQSYCALC